MQLVVLGVEDLKIDQVANRLRQVGELVACNMQLNKGLALADCLGKVAIWHSLSPQHVMRQIKELQRRQREQSVRHHCQLVCIEIEADDCL